MSANHLLTKLGWQPYFQQQLDLDEWDNATPARIIEQHRSEYFLSGEFGEHHLSILSSMPEMVVGDWLLLDDEMKFVRLLERKTLFARKAAGTRLHKQLIAANIDVAFVVTSMNEDFNLNRLERFLAMVHDAGVEPVVILSKSDLAEVPEDFLDQINQLDPMLVVESVNCLDPESVAILSPWLKESTTITVLGSSGVGKSTLINTMMGEETQATSHIREDDSKGRHTTTSRSLIKLPDGGLILDTPGMRELQLADCKDGISSTFSDIETLAENCRFGDCQHQTEPGCAVRQAVESGALDARRLDNYLKLLKEEAFNSASLSERRASDRALGKFYKTTLGQANRLKGR